MGRGHLPKETDLQFTLMQVCSAITYICLIFQCSIIFNKSLPFPTFSRLMYRMCLVSYIMAAVRKDLEPFHPLL